MYCRPWWVPSSEKARRARCTPTYETNGGSLGWGAIPHIPPFGVRSCEVGFIHPNVSFL